MKRTKRLMSLLLVSVFVLTLLPNVQMPVYAAYADGQECFHCGHYHWDDYMCPDCGACTVDCTNDWCYFETHCERCGECLMNSGGFCTECNLCESCMADMGHCSECGICWMDDDAAGNLCADCHRCSACVEICETCGMCFGCANDVDDGFHCPLCGNCYQQTEQCQFIENNHCKDCCEPCGQCGECIAGEHLETCPDCGLCVECCEFNSMMAGCVDGDICVESSEWIDSTCCDCGGFFTEDYEMCATCMDAGYPRCEACCRASSECSESMCEYDEEYDEHFCIDCGQCFHDADRCPTCEANRCEDCCAARTEANFGCTHDYCEEDPYFDSHLAECEDVEEDFVDAHDAMPSNRWTSNGASGHYRACRFCDSEAHDTGRAAHSFDTNGVCVVCGYSAGSKLYIARQPKTARCNTSIYSSGYDEDSDNGLFYYGNNPVTFSVVAKGGTGSYTYQWYRKYRDRAPTTLTDELYGGQFSGTNTAVLTVQVSTEACMDGEDFQYYCVVKDGKSTVTTEWAIIRANHVYSSKYATNSEAKKPATAAYKAVVLTYLNSRGLPTRVVAPASAGHRYQCLCEYHTDTLHFQNNTPVKHTFGLAILLGRSARANATNFDKVYTHTCTACGYKTYYETHKHVYYADTADYERYNHGTFQVDEAKTTNMAHALICLVDGCDHVKMESHEWDWRHMGYGNDEENGGIFYRDCLICEYPDYDYRPVDADGKTINWTTKNILITARNAQVSRVLGSANSSLILTLNNNEQMRGKRCTGWTVTYTTPNGRANNITFRYSFRENDDGSWSTTITTAGWPTGGILLFTPTLEICNSHSYVTDGYVPAVCMYDGFAGYRICKYCHAEDPTDSRSDEERILPAAGTAHTGGKTPLYQKEVISSSGKKTITWTTNKSESNGKRYNYAAGDCHTKGCVGDSLCTACRRVIPGKKQYQHPSYAIEERNYVEVSCFRDGYSGDLYCSLCGKRVPDTQGYVIPAPRQHTTTTEYLPAVAPTCTTAGKGAVERCMLCNEFLCNDPYIAPLGHDWAVDEANCTESTVAYQCTRSGCLATRFSVDRTTHAVVVEGGKAYVGGKIVTKAKEGEIVALRVDGIPEGKYFQEWEVIRGGVVLKNAAAADGASFIMGAQDVRIHAVFADDKPIHFTDVLAGSYYEEAVKWAVDQSVTNGVTAMTFAPYNACTRGQAVTFLWRAAGCPAPKLDTSDFTDVKPGRFYDKAVLWAVENGITKGTSKTTFSPDEICSRAQIVTFLWRSQGAPALSAVNPFGDVRSGTYYVDAVLWAVKEGITNGTSAAAFSPDNDCTRAQIVTFLYRALAH